MRYSGTAVSILIGLGNIQVVAAEPKGGLRRNRTLREAKSDACSISVVKKFHGADFECEMDPADVDGRAGVRRKLKASPRQVKDLRAMLSRGQLVSGESILIHEGASFDNEHLHVPPGLHMHAKVMGREERRLAERMFPVEEFAGAGRRLAGTKGEEKESFIVEFVDADDAGAAAKCDAAAKSGHGTVSLVYKKVNGCAVMMTKTDAKALETNPNVKLVEHDGIMTASQVMSPPMSWGLDRIDQDNLPLDNTKTKLDATGVKVFIVDTGIYAANNDFGGIVDGGCSKSFVGGDGNGKELNDGNGHGTHVASTVCGVDYGVSACDRLCAVRVLSDSGSGSTSGVIAGFDHAITECREGDLCVLNASLGGGLSSTMNDAAKRAVEHGIVVVVAAGNSNEDACDASPASEPLAITVGSTTSSDGASSFTNYGDCVDVYAPGSSIKAAWYRNPTDTKTISGTSMASPHVAGIGAAVLKASPGLGPAGVMNQIAATWTKQGFDDRTPNVGMARTSAVDSNATSGPTSAPTAYSCSGMEAELTVTTDNYPTETSWQFKNTCTDEIQKSGGSYSGAAATYDEKVCLPSGQRYEFTIFDSYGDGICCSYGQGSYTLTVEGDIKKEGGEFASSETTSFGGCGTSPTTPPPAAPTTPPPVTPAPTPNPTPAPVTPAPTPIPTPSPRKTVSCGSTRSGSKCPSPRERPADSLEKHEVRCCSDDASLGWQTSCDINGTPVYAASRNLNDKKCNARKTLAQAEEICANAAGGARARLCTLEEVLADCTKGTGCNFDRQHIWTSTDYVGQDSITTKATVPGATTTDFNWDETTVSSALDIAMEVDAACDPEAGDPDACEVLCDGRLCCFEEGAGSCLGDPAKACLEYAGCESLLEDSE